MTIVVRIIQWVAGIVGLSTLILGLIIWIAGMINLINFHILSGLVVTLMLLFLSILAVSTRGMRLLGVGSIIFALIVPLFGVTQFLILRGDFHWVIRVAHLLVGLGALALIWLISTHYLRLKQASPNFVASPQAVRS